MPGASLRPVLARALAATLLTLLAGMVVQASAGTPGLAALLRPSGVREVHLSPSGSRAAALVEDPQSGSNLLVLEDRQGRLVSLLSTHLGLANAIATYRWLSDDYIAIYYAGADEDFPQFGIVDIPHHAIRVQDPLTRIEKAPWGDDTHILLSATGNNCRAHVLSRCLLSMDIRSGNTNRISDPFTQGPATFLAVSPAEIYASGRDAAEHEHDFQLEIPTNHWKPIADGTVERRRQELQDVPAPPDVQQQRARAEMPGALPVWTEPDHHLVGLEGIAPERAFLALDSRLDGVQALLEQRYQGARVQVSGLNADLTRGMVIIDGPDQPPLYAFFNESGSLTQYAQLEPDLSSSMLGHTHVEGAWIPDMPVAVTLPPQGTAPIGAVIEPIVAAAAQSEEPLAHYDGLVQALAQSGLVVVRPLVVIPNAFASRADGGVWRQAQLDRLHLLMNRVRSELVPGRGVCLYGEDLAATLALAWSAGTQVDCTVAVGARLDPAAYTHRIGLVREQPPARDVRHGRMFVPASPGQVFIATTTQQLHRDLPAQFGVSGNAQLLDPTQWVAQLPMKLMLAYDMNQRQQQEFASESAAFRRAAQHAGRRLDFYTDEAVGIDDVQSRDRLLQAVVNYLQQNMSTAAAASAAAGAP